jgi:hypothetical protein
MRLRFAPVLALGFLSATKPAAAKVQTPSQLLDQCHDVTRSLHQLNIEAQQFLPAHQNQSMPLPDAEDLFQFRANARATDRSYKQFSTDLQDSYNAAVNRASLSKAADKQTFKKLDKCIEQSSGLVQQLKQVEPNLEQIFEAKVLAQIPEPRVQEMISAYLPLGLRIP